MGAALAAGLFAAALGPFGGRPARSGEDGYPDLFLRFPYSSCFAWNRGPRVFGWWYLGNLYCWDVCFPGAQAFGDIDGDGRLDRIVEGGGVFLGHGDGVFGIMTVAFMNQNSRMAIASADLDKDGYDDVLLGTHGIKVYFGQPDGTLREGGDLGLRYSLGDTPPLLKLLDIDGDGFEDILGASDIGPLLAFGRGDGTFEPYLEGDAATFSMRSKLCDLDGDGKLDIVRTGRIHLFRSGFIALCVNFGTGRGFTTPAEEIPIEGLDYWNDFPAGVTTGDFNRDGFVDVATGGGWGKLAIFLGNGDGTFQPQITETLPVFDPPTALLFHDLDLDGLGDLVVGYWHAPLDIYWGVEDGFVDYEHPLRLWKALLMDIEVGPRIWRPFLRGDANDDRRVDLADAVMVLRQLFLGEPMVCGDASDADDDGEVRMLDAIYLLRYLFGGQAQPPPPYPEPGGDRVRDEGWGWSDHWGGDLGCSYETFHYYPAYSPCFPDNDQSECAPRQPIRQFIDVAVPELICPDESEECP